MQTKIYPRLLSAIAIFFTLNYAANAVELFTEPTFVTLKESDQIAKFPGQTIWPGGPKMLYNSVTPDDKLSVIDLKTLKLSKLIKLSSFPFWIAVNGNP